jgi:rod shape-determining protein MreC
VLVSAVLIVLESTTRLLEPVRGPLSTLVVPLHAIAALPYLVTYQLGDVFSTHDSLVRRNAELERRVLELSQISQQYLALQTENERLRGLLGSRSRLPEEVLIAEIIGIVPGPSTHQVILDKGANADLRPGDPVIDAHGLFGQVVEVNRFTSRVMLVTDSNHAVPVQVNRNGVRSIAGGTGQFDMLQLENVSVTADIQQGDRLETSGLDGRFPAGYPVGYVDRVNIEPTAAFANVAVRPLAQLDRSRHVLVVLVRPPAQAEDGIESNPGEVPPVAPAAQAPPGAGSHEESGAEAP